MSEHTDPQDSSMDLTGTSSSFPWSELVFPAKPELPPEMKGFQLCDSLGSGSTGTVYRSVQTKEFAVKVVPWHPNNLRETARREYDMASLFADCEQTVHVFAYYEHDGNSFILQEIGEPIMDYFFRNPCTLETLLRTLLDISGALGFIHSRGYTHFDVKPGNILAVNGKAKLGDFSHCLHYVRGQEYDRPMGTSAFKAPEIVSGSRHSGLEDMYSLGVTMYVLLMAGLLPFEGKSGDSRDQGRRPIRSLFIHPDLLSIIQKAAAYDPAERYQRFEDFSKDILSFMDRHHDQLDEKVPAYLSNDLKRPTIPPFTAASTIRSDLS